MNAAEENESAIHETDSLADLDSLAPEHYTSLKRSLSRVTSAPKLEPNYFHDAAKSESRPSRMLPAGEALQLNLPTVPMAAEVALTALQCLPTPLIVLSSLKTIVLANEAMGRLLGLQHLREDWDEEVENVTDLLKGQTLSQIGVDMISEGAPVWVSWEKFLDNIAAGKNPDDENGLADDLSDLHSDETTPVATPHGSFSGYDPSAHRRGRSPFRERTFVHDTAVDVMVSAQYLHSKNRPALSRIQKPRSPGVHTTCRMIISIWYLANQKYFSLSFTSSSGHRSVNSHTRPHIVHRAASSASTRSSRSSHSRTPTSSISSSTVQSPSEGQVTAFPPAGAPAKCNPPQTHTEFQKVSRMKEAMLKTMQIPVLAMWKDESVVFPNPAARRLLAVDADPTSDESYDFMSRFNPWAADFSRQLDESENPIIALCRTQKAFTRWQIGLINEKTGKRSNFDVSGHPVFDEKSGEFFAGFIAFKDVTEYTEKIASQTAENEEQFKVICDTMPQMLWTTRPDGYHDYFSQRWYDYTGLNPSNSLGLGWKLPFHDDDMAETGRRWGHSLATGEEYLTEYRCRRYDGAWRWMLGRALPLREQKTGKILKWFGTCTDIQDIVDARNNATRSRQQLLDVLHHSQMHMWIVDREAKITFFEGHAVEGITPDQLKTQCVGISVYDAMKDDADPKFIGSLKSGVNRILSGTSSLEIYESEHKNRWIRSRLVPLRGKMGANGVTDEDYISGVVGIGTEVTEVRRKEQENIKLLANESAAKEASKMKSNFLANMSHEIRTPIAGVLGMSELLMDTKLDTEQSEFAQNIQRSANSLLTVINDILDFSKIESGRLDIEEVQFSLGVVLRDVAKMLSYAAQRKNLSFNCDLQLGEAGDLVLLGDPGRIRQILTNLLTNSIKFTSDGFVNLNARILSTTTEVTTIEFSVQDSGIGIEEEVKKRLFRPFSQADSSTARRFGGTGLGLTISKNLVDLMRGSIKLDSKLDVGTTAVFTIPFKRPEFLTGSSTPLVEVGALPDRLHSELSLSCNTSSTADATSLRRTPPIQSPKSIPSNIAQAASVVTNTTLEAAQHDVARERHHILVVEDNAVNQQIAIKFIRSLRFSVSAVWNGREALEYLLKATSPTITPEEAKVYKLPSIILMDVQMPVLDGYHATHLLRHHAPYTAIESIQKIPIVAMTASAIQGDREKCEKAGMDDYLAKPVKRPILEKMIVKWVRKAEQSRRASLVVSDAGKPLLTRSITDHSSNCPEHDHIATEFMTSRAVLSNLNQHNPGDDLTPRGSPNPRSTRRPSELRRSSLSHSMLVNGMPRVESEAESEMRRAEAEEKARALRDAKLISATEDEHALGPPIMDVPALVSALDHPSSGASSAYDQAHSDNGILALTEENVERLNSQEGSEPEMEVGRGGFRLPVFDIPGPPAEIVARPPRTTAHQVGVNRDTSNTKQQKKRIDYGGLKPGDRRMSDRSVSTAKQE